MFIGQLLEKIHSIGTLVNIWHQTLTTLQILEKGIQLVLDQLIIMVCHPKHLPNTLKQLEGI